MTGRSRKLARTLRKRKVNIAFMQKTMQDRKGVKGKKLEMGIKCCTQENEWKQWSWSNIT